MATQASAVWRIRPGGNSANGAGYDAAISGAGTDYTQQDAAQLTLSDVACSSNTTVTSTTGGFTSAMIGNAIRITGGGASSGYYWITARASTNSITVDRSPGSVSGGSGRVGGAAALPANLGTDMVAGNTIYLLGVAGNASSYPTSSLDYTTSSYITPTNGNTTAGWVKWIADPAGPMPTFASDGAIVHSGVMYQWFEGIYFTTTSNNFGNLGIMSAYVSSVLKSCIINTNNQASMVGATVGIGVVMDCEFYGGTTTPTANSGSHLLVVGANGATVVGNTFRFGRDAGISTSESNMMVAHNVVMGCAGNGIQVAAVTVSAQTIMNNTIRGNAGHGISIAGSASSMVNRVFNNIISDHVGSGKAGIAVTSGSAALNDHMKALIDYNDLYNNTANYSGISAGANDLALDPQFVAPTSNPADFAIGTNLKAEGFPHAIRGAAATSYFDMGAYQREEPAGGGGAIGGGNLSGGLQ